jgi:DNA-binding transcriptional LysR family regulator
MFRQQILQALDQAGVPWRISAVSPSLTGLWAAAIAGLGVTVRGSIGLPVALQANGTMFDLPALNAVPITLHSPSREKPGAVERLIRIVSDLVEQTFPRRNAKLRSRRSG